MGTMRPSLFRGPQADATRIAIPIPIIAGCIGFQVSWPDATTEGEFALEYSSFSSDDAPTWEGGTAALLPGQGTAFVITAPAPQHWVDSGETIAPVTPGAAGSFPFFATNVRAQRARLLIDATAVSNWDVRPGITDV